MSFRCEYLKSKDQRNQFDTFEYPCLLKSDDFSKQKIVWGEISDKSKFAYDESGLFPEATTFFMIGNKLKYILAILNSNIGEWLFNQIGTTTGMGTNRWKKYKLESLLVKTPTQEEEEEIIKKVDSLLKDNLSIDTLTEINSLVYKMYELTENEIKFIELGFK